MDPDEPESRLNWKTVTLNRAHIERDKVNLILIVTVYYQTIRNNGPEKSK